MSPQLGSKYIVRALKEEIGLRNRPNYLFSHPFSFTFNWSNEHQSCFLLGLRVHGPHDLRYNF